jgi:predicted transcriptional regulator
MIVTFPSELEEQLTRLASRQGKDSATVVIDAVRQMIDHDSWFMAEVDKGLAQIAAGSTLSHEQAGQRLDQFLRSKQRSA